MFTCRGSVAASVDRSNLGIGTTVNSNVLFSYAIYIYIIYRVRVDYIFTCRGSVAASVDKSKLGIGLTIHSRVTCLHKQYIYIYMYIYNIYRVHR